ncbi:MULTISPECIES: lytic transglycosylase domain-containing protein [Gordonia]|nr:MULTISPECIES: lytic murein transglycosylase [Gordonia]
MGKHSKPSNHAKWMVTAMVPVAGGLVATAAGADAHTTGIKMLVDAATPSPDKSDRNGSDQGTPDRGTPDRGAQDRGTAATTGKHRTPEAAPAPDLVGVTPARQVAGPAFIPPAQSSAAVSTPSAVATGEIPVINYKAYKTAADTMARTTPGCGIPWTIIGGIGRVESHHANMGDASADGTLKNAIYGPRLDGSLAGNQVITDTDGGALDGDAAYDRAVGPMQFLPSTWRLYAADGNGDGKADPQNLYDAALTTARYLCAEGINMRTDDGQTRAILRYNQSYQYVADVRGYARNY